MRISALFVQEEFIADYQDATKSQFLVDKELRVCRKEVNFLSTNS